MTKTKIEWTDEVWNPVTGCTKVSAGCKNCYAERIFQRPYPGRAFTDVRCHPERLDAPLHWRKSRMIFVNSMSDLFHEDVPDEFIDQIFDVMASANQHTFQVLTKRAVRMQKYVLARLAKKQAYADKFDLCPTEAMRNSPAAKWAREDAARVPAYIWLGVSVEDQATADERIPLLLQTPAAVRWISAEPLLAPINLSTHDIGNLYWLSALTGRAHIMHDGGMPAAPTYGKLDWVVTGGESGPNARPSHPDWFRSLRDQCRNTGVRFFMKQITERGSKIQYEAFPSDLMVREYPS